MNCFQNKNHFHTMCLRNKSCSKSKGVRKKRDTMYIYSLLGIAAVLIGGTIYCVSKRKTNREDDLNNV